MGERFGAIKPWEIDAPYPSDCIEWERFRNNRGYGQTTKTDGTTLVHRLALAYRLGRDIAPGLFACHHCDNPSCYNPGHLFEGSPRENSMDMVRKGRSSRPNFKFSESDVLAIVEACKNGAIPTRLAREYGVTQNAVFNILRGITWRQVTGIARKSSRGVSGGKGELEEDSR